jgi:glycerol-3-phosphate acyltransferase PlsY
LGVRRSGTSSSFLQTNTKTKNSPIAGSPAWEIAATVGLAALVLLRHTENIRRLVRGDELSASRS